MAIKIANISKDHSMIRKHSPSIFTLCILIWVAASCGPGFKGYDQQYSDIDVNAGAPWQGDESVFVALDQTNVKVSLKGMTTYDYLGAPAVLLSEIIINSGLASDPTLYRYDFTATDGYDLLRKRYNDPNLLPGWNEMKGGYLYFDTRYNDLTCGWTINPWGSALSAYKVKWMNSGVVTLLLMQ